jgi:hypothetical protein
LFSESALLKRLFVSARPLQPREAANLPGNCLLCSLDVLRRKRQSRPLFCLSVSLPMPDLAKSFTLLHTFDLPPSFLPVTTRNPNICTTAYSEWVPSEDMLLSAFFIRKKAS